MFKVQNNNKITNNTDYGYDDNGNMTTHKYNNVTYAWRDMMTVYGSNTYDYDTMGQRVRKYEAGEYRYYVTSGMNILSEHGNDQGLEVEHIYVGINRIASIVAGDDIYYVCSDQVMSSRALVAEDGATNQRRDYYPFGNTEYATGAVSDYQFSSKERDETGLYYFGARYYDPTIGRWLATDPAGQFHSPYVYAGNNPLIMVDPDGELVGLLLFGAYMNVMINMGNIDNGKDLFAYAAIGAVGALIGSAGTPANWALNTGIGALQGGLVGGLNSSLTAGSWAAFGQGAKTGALWGGVGGFASSEAAQNFFQGDGFVNNGTLFDQWNDGTVEGFSKISDKFGNGEFRTSSDELWNQPNFTDEVKAATDRQTGEIFFNERAFSNGYDKFLEYSGKEKWLSNAVNAKNLPESWTNAEILSYKYLYKNYGLIRPANSQLELYSKSIRYLTDPFTGQVDMTYYWEISRWDWIYRIPRRY